jgi:hypothetical protein
MLCSFLGVNIDQKAFEAAAGLKQNFYLRGMSVQEMAQAAKKALPIHLKFWWKFEANLEEIDQILKQEKHPLGIEWQGVFLQYADEDDGHFSVITHLDLANGYILIADPFGPFSSKDRIFRPEFFEKRWWDANDVYDPTLGRNREVIDHHGFFLITDASQTFPLRYSMQTLAPDINP